MYSSRKCKIRNIKYKIIIHSRNNVDDFWLKFWDWRTVQRSALCRFRRELSNEYLLAKFGFDTAENEVCKVCPLSAYRSPWFAHWLIIGKEERRLLLLPDDLALHVGVRLLLRPRREGLFRYFFVAVYRFLTKRYTGAWFFPVYIFPHFHPMFAIILWILWEFLQDTLTSGIF